MYIRALRNRLTGFAGVNTRQILEHLYATYGDISAKDLADNHTKMNTPHDPNLPIESLMYQIDEATELADVAKAPYMAPQIVAIVYNLIQQTGIFTLDCENWDEKADTDKTWVNFKLFSLLIIKSGDDLARQLNKEVTMRHTSLLLTLLRHSAL